MRSVVCLGGCYATTLIGHLLPALQKSLHDLRCPILLLLLAILHVLRCPILLLLATLHLLRCPILMLLSTLHLLRCPILLLLATLHLLRCPIMLLLLATLHLLRCPKMLLLLATLHLLRCPILLLIFQHLCLLLRYPKRRPVIQVSETRLCRGALQHCWWDVALFGWGSAPICIATTITTITPAAILRWSGVGHSFGIMLFVAT